MHNELCERLGIEFPIFAFSHCRDVVAAVTNAGGIGVLGALAFSPEQLELELKWIDEHVNGKSYGVDVVIPASHVGSGFEDAGALLPKLQEMVPQETKEWIDGVLDELGVPPLPTEVDAAAAANADDGGGLSGSGLLGWTNATSKPQVEVALAHDIKLLANALGPPPKDVVDAAHEHGVTVAALVGRPDQARKQVEQGVDIVIAQGTEAGGHTGEIATMVLVPEVVEAVAPTPVLAAGGIGSGRQMAAAMALGAAGVWTGSIWLGVAESNTGPEGMDRLFAATARDAVRSRSLTGKPAAHAADRMDRRLGAGRLPGHVADAAAVHGDPGSAGPHRAVGSTRPVRHAGGSDRRQHEPRPDVAAGRARHGAGVHRHRGEDGRWPRG